MKPNALTIIAAALASSVVMLSAAPDPQSFPVTGNSGALVPKTKTKAKPAEANAPKKEPIVLTPQQTKAYNDREIARAQLSALNARNEAIWAECSRIQAVLDKYRRAGVKDPGLESRYNALSAQSTAVCKQMRLLDAKIASCEFALPDALVPKPQPGARRK